MNIKKHIKESFSIDEKKVSTLIVLLFVFSIVSVYMIIQNGDMPANLTSLMFSLITGVVGVNIVNDITQNHSNSNYTQNSQEQYEYGEKNTPKF